MTFVIGFLAGIILLLAALYTYARLGYVDFHANQPVSSIEKDQAMAFVHASTGRNAPETKNPLPSNEADLTAGMELFQSHCAVCHGDINHGSPLAESLYPRAPQFRRQKADMGETRPSI